MCPSHDWSTDVTDGSYYPPELSGEVVMVGSHDFTGSASAEWQALPSMELELPRAGRYHLFADVRASINNTSTGNAFIRGRIFDVTAGAPVSDSERIVALANAVGGATGSHEQTTGSVNTILTVGVPTTVRLEGARSLGGGVTDADLPQQGIFSDTNGRTTFAFAEIGRVT